jgi:chromosome segregation ATPase
LYRVEAERLHLQQQAAGLADNKQQLTADVFKLQQQLESAHAALTDSQQQLHHLTTSRDRLQVQVCSICWSAQASG